MKSAHSAPDSEPIQRYILIEAGTVAGPSPDPNEPCTHFFVSMVTGDDQTRMWEGASHADAVRIAGLWANWKVIDATEPDGAG